MGMLNRIKGNLRDMADAGEFDIIVHGCNCQNTMGSGIAKVFRERWPEVYEADCEATKLWKIPEAKLGNFSIAYVLRKNNKPLGIVNAYTQINYLPRGIDHFEYESFYLILRKLEAIAARTKINFGFPYIGMGLAGGDPFKIIPMLEVFAIKLDVIGSTVTLVEYNG